MSEQANPYASPEAAVADHAPDDLIATAIGPKNTDYYLDFIARSSGKPWTLSWNWPAFFVTSFWLLYRKMWAVFFIYVFAAPIALTMLSAVVSGVLGEIAGSVIYIVGMLALVFGFAALANAFYVRKLDALVTKAEKQCSDISQQRDWLQSRGGTSLVWLIALLIIPMMVGILAAVALPAYEDYMEKAAQAAVQRES